MRNTPLAWGPVDAFPLIPTTSWGGTRPWWAYRTALPTLKPSVLEKRKGLLVEPGEDLQLDEVHSPLAGLNLGDKAGLFSEFLGDLPLGQPSLDSRGLELALESSVSRTVKGVFWHCLFLPNKQAYLCILYAPKIGARMLAHIVWGGPKMKENCDNCGVPRPKKSLRCKCGYDFLVHRVVTKSAAQEPPSLGATLDALGLAGFWRGLKEQLVPSTETTPPNSAQAGPRRCSGCQSENVKKVSLVWAEGTSFSGGTFSALGVGVATGDALGAGVFGGAIQGATQTALAKKLAPPEEPGFSLGWPFLLGILTLATFGSVLIIWVPMYALAHRTYREKLAQWEKTWVCLSCGMAC